jgi:hypothetical protein
MVPVVVTSGLGVLAALATSVPLVATAATATPAITTVARLISLALDFFVLDPSDISSSPPDFGQSMPLTCPKSHVNSGRDPDQGNAWQMLYELAANPPLCPVE